MGGPILPPVPPLFRSGPAVERRGNKRTINVLPKRDKLMSFRQLKISSNGSNLGRQGGCAPAGGRSSRALSSPSPRST
jgi:hypothetical protein